MTKERSRFDALVEELFEEEKPEEKPELKPRRKTLTKEAKARLDAIVDSYKPDEDLPEDFDAESGREYKFPPPPQPSVPKRNMGRRPKAKPESNAYLSAMGRMYPVVECHVRSVAPEDKMYRDPYDQRLDRIEARFEVVIKLATRIENRILQEGDPALVMIQGDETLYYKLSNIQTKWTMTSIESSCEITAEARQLVL